MWAYTRIHVNRCSHGNNYANYQIFLNYNNLHMGNIILKCYEDRIGFHQDMVQSYFWTSGYP